SDLQARICFSGWRRAGVRHSVPSFRMGLHARDRASSPSAGKRPLLHLFWRFSTEGHGTARPLRDMVQILPSLSGLPGKPILTERFIAHRISSLTASTL